MTNWGWVSREFAKSNATDTVYQATVDLLRFLDDLKLGDGERKDVLHYASELTAGHSIATPEETERWMPVIPGYYSIGDTIRVHNNAYDGEKGLLHNGKRGRVTAARDGFVLVVYEDALSADIQYRHLPEKLQRLA